MTTAMTTAIRRQTQIAAHFADDDGRHAPEVLLTAREEIGHAQVAALVDPGFTESANRADADQGRGMARAFRGRKYLVHGGARKNSATHPVKNIAVLGVVGTLPEKGLHQ